MSFLSLLVDQQGLKESHSSHSEKVNKTRQSTLNDFNIDLDTMTAVSSEVAPARNVSQCKNE
jgi:hypothetical protein